MLVAGLSLYGFVLAFIVEDGYAWQQDIPQELIEVDTHRVLNACTAVAGVAFFLFMIANVIYIARPKVHQVIRRELVGLCGLITWMVAIVWIHGRDWGAYKWYLLVFAAFAVVPLAHALIVFRKYPGIIAKIEAQQKRDDQVISLMDVVIRRIGLQSSIALGLLVLGVGIAWNIGVAQARQREEYLIVADNPILAVLRIYGDQLVCREFDRGRKLLGERIEVLNLDQCPALVLERVGPLKSAKR